MTIIKRHKETVFLAFLSAYHFFFTFINWNYYLENGGDAAFYWFQLPSSATKSISDLGFYGSDFILLLNYPFAKLIGLDIYFGFFIYGLIGLFGIIQFYRLLQFHLGNRLQFFGLNCWGIVLFLPNLHFWTAMLGKEALCFLFIATILLELSKENYKSVVLIGSMVFLILIRPHIALMLVFSVFISHLFFGKLTVKTKLIMSGITVVVCSGLFYMFLQLSKIKTLDFDRIKRFNEFSLLSFKDSDTYVPIITYSYPYKLFTFYFRPLLYEIPTLYGISLGLENMLLLLLHAVAFVFFLLHYKKLVFPLIFKIILCFAIISGLLIVQRYSGFGIFARTKVMIQPFVVLVLLWIIAQGNNKSTVNNQ